MQSIMLGKHSGVLLCLSAPILCEVLVEYRIFGTE